jgi:hypothetical protein
MSVYTLNSKVMSLAPDHVARRFLEAFVACRESCVGRELPLSGKEPVEQSWRSATDGKEWRFSEFTYKFLAFDVELDGWLTNAPEITTAEKGLLETLPLVRVLLNECLVAAQKSQNEEICGLVIQIQQMYELWEACIHERIAS